MLAAMAKKQGFENLRQQLFDPSFMSLVLKDLPDCDCPIYLEPLQCPFTWKLVPLPEDECEYNRDKLFLASTPWCGVFERLRLVYSLYVYDRVDEARAQLINAYMYLLPGLREGCSFVNEYHEALRYVLDATYAGMALVTRPKPCVGLEPPLKAFLSSITPFERLSKRQRAAVYAMQARFNGEQAVLGGARKAVAMEPAEGEWRHLLGSALQAARSSQPLDPAGEEVSALRAACRLRRSPTTMTSLARSLADGGVKERAEARQLIQEALKLYPENPAVHYQAVEIISLTCEGPEPYAEMMDLLKRALSMAGECALIHMRMGLLLVNHGKAAAGKHEFKRAFFINREASDFFTKTFMKKSKGQNGKKH